MARLKKAKLVETKEGVEGGYQLAVAADKIDLKTIADTLEISFVSASWRSGNPEMSCMISSGMAGVLDGLYTDLNNHCREQMEQITIADLENKIFKTA